LYDAGVGKIPTIKISNVFVRLNFLISQEDFNKAAYIMGSKYILNSIFRTFFELTLHFQLIVGPTITFDQLNKLLDYMGLNELKDTDKDAEN
jgi:hypothetical protein